MVLSRIGNGGERKNPKKRKHSSNKIGVEKPHKRSNGSEFWLKNCEIVCYVANRGQYQKRFWVKIVWLDHFEGLKFIDKFPIWEKLWKIMNLRQKNDFQSTLSKIKRPLTKSEAISKDLLHKGRVKTEFKHKTKIRLTKGAPLKFINSNACTCAFSLPFSALLRRCIVTVSRNWMDHKAT